MKKYTKYQMALEIISAVIIAAIVIYVGIVWKQVPKNIPMHYGINNMADAYGDKSQIFVPLLLAVGSYILFSFCVHFEKFGNIPFKVTQENKGKVYSLMRSFLLECKVMVTVIFAYMTYVFSKSPTQMDYIILFVFPLLPIVLVGLKIHKINKEN